MKLAQPLAKAADRPVRVAAFTVVELVAILCIAALGFLIGAPALGSARRDAGFARCQDNLRKIASASRAYAGDDPLSFLIPVHPNWETAGRKNLGFGAYEYGGKSGIGSTAVPEKGDADSLDSPFGSLAGVGPATRPLNPYVTGEEFEPAEGFQFRARADAVIEIDEFRCPADDGPPSGGHCPDWIRNRERSSFDHFGTSYAANLFPIASSGGGPVFSNSPFLRPSSRVPNPARTLLYEENIGRWAWAARRELDECAFVGRGVDVGLTKSLGAWHGEDWNYNRGFVDGSARYQSIYIEGSEDQDGYANHYRSEIVYPDDESLQGFYGCIIVRGDGWQKDTLPADRVPTGQIFSGSGRPSYGDCAEPSESALRSAPAPLGAQR